MEGLKVKHTDGPWWVRGTVVIGDGYELADCGVSLKPMDESIANAHLIASAPELLEALHKVVNEAGYALRYKHGEDVDTLRKALANMIVLCADPISKAEGRS